MKFTKNWPPLFFVLLDRVSFCDNRYVIISVWYQVYGELFSKICSLGDDFTLSYRCKVMIFI